MKTPQKKSARHSAAAAEATIAAAVQEVIDATRHYSATVDVLTDIRNDEAHAEALCGAARQAESDRKKELVMTMKRHGFEHIRTGGVLVSRIGESLSVSKDVFVDLTA